MSLKEAASCDLLPVEEWGTAGPQTSRDAVLKRTGAASCNCNMRVANANGMVFDWGGVPRSSWANVNWVMVPFYIDGAPVGREVYGPIQNTAGLGATTPYFTGITTMPGPYLAVYGSTLVELVRSTIPVPVAAWNVLLTEWNIPNKRIRCWIWNAGTSSWELYIDFTAAVFAPATFIRWGFLNFKSGTLNMAAWIDDPLWIDNTGSWPTSIPASPAECYAGYPIAGPTTYGAWTGNWSDVDDLTAGGANDGDVTKVNSGVGLPEIKQTFQFTAGICPGNRPIVGVGMAELGRVAAGSNGAVKHLLLGDGGEQKGDQVTMNAAYFQHSQFRDHTPNGNVWTPALVDGLEYGLVRESGGAAMRDFYCTAAHLVAAECQVRSPGADPTAMGLSPARF